MKLIVPDIFSAALRQSWRQRRALFDIALLPIVFSLVIDMVFKPLLVDTNYTIDLQRNPAGMMLGIIAYFLLSLMPWAAFAVGWTRHCLVGMPAAHASWTWRETRYFGAMLKLFLVYAGCLFLALMALMILRGGQMPTSKSLVLMGLGLLFAVGYLLARLCLVLPAAAVDLRFDLGTALRYSQRNGWRLFVVLILLLLLAYFGGLFVVIVVARLLMLAFGQPLTLGPDTVLTLIEEIVSYGLSAPFLAAMAMSFRQLTGWRPDGELGPLPQTQTTPTHHGGA